MGFNSIYPNTPVQNSGWSHAPDNDEAGAFLERWRSLAQRVKTLGARIPAEQHDAYFQLLEYPACAGAAMAEKMILAEKARLTGSSEFARQSHAAVARIEQLTAHYNGLGNGKWQGIMHHTPRGLPVFGPPVTTPQDNASAGTQAQAGPPTTFIDPTKLARVQDHDGRGWRVLEGLGPRGAVIVVLPREDVPSLRDPAAIRERTPCAEYTIEREQAGEVEIILEALPTHRFTPDHEILAAVAIGDDEPIVVEFDKGKDDEHDPTWQTNILRSMMPGAVTMHLPAGTSTLKLFAADAGVMVHGIKLVSADADAAH
jgi:hypothetical protein